MAPKPSMQPVKPTSLFDTPDAFFQGAVVYKPDMTSLAPAKVPLDAELGDQQSTISKLEGLTVTLPETPAGGGEGDSGEAMAASGETSEEALPSQRGMTCGTCGGVQFTSLVEQRLHFKSDVHRLNVKRRLKGKPSLTEAEFESKISSEAGSSVVGTTGTDGSDVSSISGSDTDSSSDDERQEGETRGLRKLDDRQLKRKAKLVFALDGGRGERFAIWRSVLLGEKETLKLSTAGDLERGDGAVSEEQILERLRRFAGAGASCASKPVDSKASRGDKGAEAGLLSKQDCGSVPGKAAAGKSQMTEVVKSTGRPSGQYWVVLLAGGGHFAGVVMDTLGPEVVAHQTFHRYVVRAKQGGRQSAKDGTGRAPKSGGASLRRYNEAALAKDIRELLGVTWKNYISTASLIFVRASSADARSLYGGEGPPLQQGDPRVRSVPLTTRRPTFKEAQRVAQALAFIEWSPPEESVVERERVPVAEAQQGGGGAKQEPEEGGRVSPVVSKVPQPAVPGAWPWGSTPPPPSQVVSSTPLHEAALANDAEEVRELLEGGANPEARDERGRTPYVLATDKEVRNVFRRFMACHMDAFDWHAAGVPSPLTDDMEASQAAKRAEKKAKMKEREKEKRRERRAEEKAKQAEQGAAAAAAKAAKEAKGGRGKGPGSSAGPGAAATASRAEDREMRAMAAERRLQMMGATSQSDGSTGKAVGDSVTGQAKSAPMIGPQCDCCGASLSGKTPFYKYSYKYCSTTCIRVHMAQLSEA